MEKWIVLPVWLLIKMYTGIPKRTKGLTLEMFAKHCPDGVWPISILMWIIFSAVMINVVGGSLVAEIFWV